MVEKCFLMPIPGSVTPFLTFLLRKNGKKFFQGVATAGLPSRRSATDSNVEMI
jgi:hypothetical protein